MESVKQHVDHRPLQNTNLFWGTYPEELILLPAGNGIVSLVILPLFLLLNFLEIWVEVQDMATEKTAEE